MVLLSEVCPKAWRNEDYLRIMDELSVLFRNKTFLLIGTGYTEEQYLDWPKTLLKCGAKNVEYLEVFQGYVDRFKGREFKVYLGDVIDIDSIFQDNSYDFVFWLHGPEHVVYEKWPTVFDKILKVVACGFLAAVPFGSYYDYQEEAHGNLYEKHIVKNISEEMIKELDVSYLVIGEKDGPASQILMWKLK